MGALGEYSETLREIESNMQQVKQMYKLSAIVVGTDAQVEMVPHQEPYLGAAMMVNRGIGLAHWNLERKFEHYFVFLWGGRREARLPEACLSSQRVADHWPEATIIAVLEAKEGWLCMNRSPY